MPSPFPGMDPFLEHPELWPDVHHRLITAIADSVAPRIRPKYWVAIEKRTYLAEPEGLAFIGRPDVAVLRERPAADYAQPTPGLPTSPVQSVTVAVPMPDVVHEGYLEVREVATGEVVTSLEVLSPSNKRPGEGRRVYQVKRQRVLASLTHLVEIDLLRGGEPMAILGDGRQAAYRILVSRGEQRPWAELYAFGVQIAIPPFPLPLRSGDTEPQVDLQMLLSELYDRAGYDLVVDYSREPVPPLPEDDAAWANALLREKGLR
jgi:hypothetical protein